MFFLSHLGPTIRDECLCPFPFVTDSITNCGRSNAEETCGARLRRVIQLPCSQPPCHTQAQPDPRTDHVEGSTWRGPRGGHVKNEPSGDSGAPPQSLPAAAPGIMEQNEPFCALSKFWSTLSVKICDSSMLLSAEVICYAAMEVAKMFGHSVRTPELTTLDKQT